MGTAKENCSYAAHTLPRIADRRAELSVKAYEHLRRAKVKHVSTAPQTLPAWNKDAGGIKAFYFRDPEDHVLEIIWFPAGKGDPKWQQPGTNLFLGIDHTAIVVSDKGVFG